MRLTWLIAILMLLAVGCASGESVAPASVPTPIPGSDIAKLEQLVTRLFTQPSTIAPDDEGEPQILVGKMPPNFGVRIPDGAYILGSVLQNDDSFQAIVDLPFDRSEGEAFFTAALAEAGWREQRRPDQPGFNTSRSVRLVYCSSGDTLLYIFLSESPVENFTEARIQATKFDNVPRSVCQEDAATEVSPFGESPDLPSLSSPAGIISSRTRNSASSTFVGASAGGASASAGMGVTFATDLSAADLEEHYREQLEALDWELLEQGAAGPVVASTWRFTTEEGEGRRGLLWVVEGPGVDQRTAFIEVTRPVK
ncbi:MAG: hypothetical protein IIA92_11710 [Chloroflexi bacterium]|nr:hypothetical protein [Chloroflexota bacterium]